MSETKASYEVETADAMEMLGKGYNHDPLPPNEFISTLSGFTLAPDVLIEKYGFVTALVWGMIYRYCQMSDGVCRAGLEKIASRLGMSERTIVRHLETLCGDGFLRDTTPDLKNRPHIYADTKKIQIRLNLSAMTESQRAMTESQRQGDRESVEDSINKQLKKKPLDENLSKKDLIDGLFELYSMPGAKKVIVKQYIASQIKIRLTMNPSGKDAETFINYAADRKIKDDQDINTFLDWWIVNFKDRAYWTFRKMEQQWPAAFIASQTTPVAPEPPRPIPASWQKIYDETPS